MRTFEVEMRDGMVACPYSETGEVEVEKCYRCQRLRAFHDEESGTRVVCAKSPIVLGGLLRARSAARRLLT